jgi:hypothetical protein
MFSTTKAKAAATTTNAINTIAASIPTIPFNNLHLFTYLTPYSQE